MCLPETLSINLKTGIDYKDSSRLISRCYSARPAWSHFFSLSSMSGAESIFLQGLNFSLQSEPSSKTSLGLPSASK
jgi:hypothetical protein